MSLKSVLIISLLCSQLISCSQVSFNRQRGVKYKRSWYATIYKQGDNIVSEKDMSEKLKQIPKTKDHIKSYESQHSIAVVLNSVGGFAFGWSLGSGFNDQGLLIGGVVLIAGGMTLDYFSQKHLIKAVRKHNKYVYSDEELIKSQRMAMSTSSLILPLLNTSF